MARYNWNEEEPQSIGSDISSGVNRLVWIVNVLMLVGVVAAIIGLGWVCTHW